MLKKATCINKGLSSKMLRSRGYSKIANVSTPNSFDYCLDLMKKQEYENYIPSLLLPRTSLQTAVAVRAFNIELVQVASVTSERMAGLMRFQFWRDCLDQIYKNKIPQHPVGIELYKAVRIHRLSKKWLSNLLDSREDIIDSRFFVDVSSLESYCEKSNSSLYYLVLQALGINDINSDHVGSHIGKAEGIIKLLRSVPFFASKNLVFLPSDVMIENKVSHEDIIRGRADAKVKDVVHYLATLSHQHLTQAQHLHLDIHANAYLAFLPAVACSLFLKKLQCADFDVFSPEFQKRRAHLPLKFLWAKLRKRYY